MIETTHVYDSTGKQVAVEHVELPEPEPEPLDDQAQLATLLAAKGVITIDEAAAVSKRTKADLTAEAVAWAVAAEVVAKR